MNKKILITILTILGLAIIAGGFYLWSQKKAELMQNNTEKQIVKQDEQGMEKEENGKKNGNNEKDKNDEKKNNQNNNSEELDFEKIDTSNWKTYRNEELGFELKYPKEWKMDRKHTNNIVVVFNSVKNYRLLQDIKNGKVYGEGYMDDVSIYFWSSILENDENKYNNLQATTIDELINKSDMISKINKIDIDNSTAYSVIRYGFGAYYTILINHNNHLYEIMFGNTSSQDELTDVHKSLIKSFKFIK